MRERGRGKRQKRKEGVRDGGERDDDRERERISGKIIAKFEYDSPRGYEPVEDIPEILQASFVRGSLSLSAVFFGPPPHTSALFFLLCSRCRSFACRQHLHLPFVASAREGRTNLRAFRPGVLALPRDLICLKVYRGGATCRRREIAPQHGP